MSQVKVNKSALASFLTGPQMQQVLRTKTQAVLLKMEELAPKDTGDLKLSLSMQIKIEAGRLLAQIVSSDPNIEAILNGTQGPYRGIPPWGPGSELGGWLGRHGFVSNRSKYQAAVHIAKVGTPGNKEWIIEAVRLALK